MELVAEIGSCNLSKNKEDIDRGLSVNPTIQLIINKLVNLNMDIERTDNEIIFRIPSNIDTLGLQRIIDYLRYKEATAESNADQNEIDKIAEESKANWWKENKSKFIKWGLLSIPILYLVQFSMHQA